ERQIDLYAGDAESALRAIDTQWPALDDSLLLMCQLTLIEALHLRARAAIAASSTREGSSRIATAERDAKRILGEKMAWSDPLAALLQAGIAKLRHDVDGARAALQRAIAAFDRCGMLLYANAARHRLGELEGGDVGRALRENAESFFNARG